MTGDSIDKSRIGDAQPFSWLRRKQMFEHATNLSVACARAQDCWLATGARQAWHWNGERFTAGGPDVVVLAVARDPEGPIYALHRAVQEKELHLSRIEGGSTKMLTRSRSAFSRNCWVPCQSMSNRTSRPPASAVATGARGVP